ncbi:MAG: universal stress protein [Burkholderiales bacterium]|nr:universal stress protein [Burkholderiales bacterium]
MTQIRSIVGATDLSAPARRAVDRAAMLARDASASLTLVHAVSAPALSQLRRWLDSSGDAERSILEDVRIRLHELAGELGARYAIDVGERVAIGRPVDEIARVADELQADLVVTGTLGAGVFRHRVIGSTAERVVKKAARPVLLVREADHRPYRRALVAVDFSAWSGPELAIATAVAPSAHIVLTHCVDMPLETRLRRAHVDEDVIERYRTTARDEAVTKLFELAERAGLDRDRWTPLVPTGLSPWMQIVRQEQEQECDLVVIGKHGQNAVEELLLGSTTGMVIAEGASDVLVCNTRDPA